MESALISLTFDDGLRCQFEQAVPILRRYDFVATFFLVANQDATHDSWWRRKNDWWKIDWREVDIAMLKQLAPRVVIPPSPKNRACIASAMEMARIAPEGPSTMAAMVTPSACPVVPPGSGRLNIISTNANAAKTEMSGITRVVSARFTRRKAAYQPTPAPA